MMAATNRATERNRKQDSDSDDRTAEVERYRQAAEDALQQLDWCIGYLHGIRKVEVSRALAKNRTHIRSQLLNREEQPMPAEQTDET
jgi:hypothetical protein